jgi:7,8-dihydropterin-6-yl-methyl-4-(beta-D-ribofuranosyl)aminobenzene 5'-phosphate synthase
LAFSAVVLTLTAADSVSAQGKAAVEIRVLYDNVRFDDNLQADWGFACLISGMEKTILFDTGAKGPVLLNNIEKLNMDPKVAELVVISHNHQDHTGGLLAFLEKNKGVSVYLPPSCSKEYAETLTRRGAKVATVTKTVEICKGVFVVGPTGGEIVEQALVLDTSEGLVIVTGCSHPGIVEMAEKAKKELKRDIYAVCGGMHLQRASEPELKSLIARLKELGVRKAGPTHCSGAAATGMFKAAFGGDFIEMGVGRLVKL